MTQYQEKIKQLVEKTINKFNQNEKYLMENDLSERCICAKFMSYLERAIENSDFRGYEVDVEYNRGNDGKTYTVKELNGSKIVVDLIIHKREVQPDGGFDNLVCIEMKKNCNRRNIRKDIIRLDKMTDLHYGFNYQAGFMIMVWDEKLSIEKEFYLGEERDNRY